MNELKTKKGMIIGGAAIAAAAVVGIGVFAVASKDPKTVARLGWSPAPAASP